MRAKRVAVLLSIMLCAAGVVTAQTEWILHPDNPVLEPPPSGAWDGGGRFLSSLLVVDGTYHLYYNGLADGAPLFQNHAVGHATSTDGVTWELDPANPVLTPGAHDTWDDYSIIGLAVIHEGSGFRMWYCGSDGEAFAVGHATSPDGSTWDKHAGNPIMSPGPAGSFDDEFVTPEAVIYHDGLYRMWYSGSQVDASPNILSRIGYAESVDGLIWTRHPEPVLDHGVGWEAWMVFGPSVFFDGQVYHMWYTGHSHYLLAVGYAVSPDGVEWTKYSGNPVLSGASEPSHPRVVYDRQVGLLEMLFTNQMTRSIDRATSAFRTPLTTSIIPAASVAAGAEGAFFQTDLELNNTGPNEVEVFLQWLPRGEDNSEPAESEAITIAPGRSVRYDNVLTSMFDLEPDSVGALRLVGSTDSVIGMSRTYNIPGGNTGGTFGQGLCAIPATEMISGTATQRILFLSEDSDSRANVGCVNATSERLRINIAVFDDHGSLLQSRTMSLDPYSNKQLNRVLGDWSPVNGYVDVWADRDDALYYCYGSLLDNRTSDPTTILPQVPTAEMTFIPAAAVAAGLEGAFFQTDVDLNNVGPTDLGYELLWLPRGADNSDPIRSRPFSLAAGFGVRYANVLGEVFDLDPDQVGALAVEAGGTDLLAMSRTYNVPSTKAAGTFGQAIPGIPVDRMIPTAVKKRIIFMNENDDFRSNVGCQNGGWDPVEVTIELFNSEGERLGARHLDLAPMSNDQITRVFRNHSPISAGYVDIWTDTPDALIYCYGSVLDNETSDPTTIPPQ